MAAANCFKHGTILPVSANLQHKQLPPRNGCTINNELKGNRNMMLMMGLSGRHGKASKRVGMIRCSGRSIEDFIGGDLVRFDLGRWLSDVEEHKALAVYSPHEGGYEGRYLNRLRYQGYYFLDLSARGLGDPETTLTKVHPVCPVSWDIWHVMLSYFQSTPKIVEDIFHFVVCCIILTLMYCWKVASSREAAHIKVVLSTRGWLQACRPASKGQRPCGLDYWSQGAEVNYAFKFIYSLRPVRLKRKQNRNLNQTNVAPCTFVHRFCQRQSCSFLLCFPHSGPRSGSLPNAETGIFKCLFLFLHF